MTLSIHINPGVLYTRIIKSILINERNTKTLSSEHNLDIKNNSNIEIEPELFNFYNKEELKSSFLISSSSLLSNSSLDSSSSLNSEFHKIEEESFNLNNFNLKNLWDKDLEEIFNLFIYLENEKDPHHGEDRTYTLNTDISLEENLRNQFSNYYKFKEKAKKANLEELQELLIQLCKEDLEEDLEKEKNKN